MFRAPWFSGRFHATPMYAYVCMPFGYTPQTRLWSLWYTYPWDWQVKRQTASKYSQYTARIDLFHSHNITLKCLRNLQWNSTDDSAGLKFVFARSTWRLFFSLRRSFDLIAEWWSPCTTVRSSRNSSTPPKYFCDELEENNAKSGIFVESVVMKSWCWVRSIGLWWGKSGR